MLDRSSSLANLALLAQMAVGQTSNSLSHPFSLIELVTAGAGGWLASAPNVWEADVVPDALQLATLTHSEMATDRYCRQIRSTIDSVVAGADPHWTAVTCYYAAFFGAQALLLQAGRGAVRVPPLSTLPFTGVVALASAPSTTSASSTTLTLSRLGGPSHRAVWRLLVELLGEILMGERDARASLVLQTLQAEIRDPVWLSDARNEINYDVTSSPFGARRWSSLLIDIDSPSAVEDELARAKQSTSERRFEVVALALGCLSKQLRCDFVRRGGRIDGRQVKARKGELGAHMWLVDP